METVTAIVTALALGATAGLKDTTKQIFKDSYAALKALVKHKFPQTITSLDQLEQSPNSQAEWDVLEGDLVKAGVASDAEVLEQAKALSI